MGSNAANTTETITKTITTSNNTNIVQNKSTGADGVALAQALSAGLSGAFGKLVDSASNSQAAALASLQSIAGAGVALNNGGQLNTSASGTSTISEKAQIVQQVGIAVIAGVVLYFITRKN